MPKLKLVQARKSLTEIRNPTPQINGHHLGPLSFCHLCIYHGRWLWLKLTSSQFYSKSSHLVRSQLLFIKSVLTEFTANWLSSSGTKDTRKQNIYVVLIIIWIDQNLAKLIESKCASNYNVLTHPAMFASLLRAGNKTSWIRWGKACGQMRRKFFVAIRVTVPTFRYVGGEWR